jgi:hypothetical protein
VRRVLDVDGVGSGHAALEGIRAAAAQLQAEIFVFEQILEKKDSRRRLSFRRKDSAAG